nr:VOC family protein [Sphingomonas sp. JE1]
MCIVTTNIERQIRMWEDLMGFETKVKMTIPDGDDWAPDVMAPRALLEDLYKVPGATATVAVLLSKEGAMIELLEPHVPTTRQTPPEQLRYADTGIHELGLVMEGIDDFFEKVRAQGYETQTEYVWPCATMGKTFLFYDPDGNLIQIWEHGPDAPAELRVG